MENQSKSCCHSNCWTKCIAIIALSISLFCLGVLVGKCCSSKGKCGKPYKCEKTYKKCHKNIEGVSTKVVEDSIEGTIQ